MRNVHPDYLGKTSVFEKSLEKTAFAAPEVYHALRLRALQSREHSAHAPLVKTQRPLDSLFLSVMRFLCGVRVWSLVCG
jgi:hypothetical protein